MLLRIWAFSWYILRQCGGAVSDKEKYIILPNGIKVQRGMWENIAQKKSQVEPSSQLGLKSQANQGKAKFKDTADAKQLTNPKIIFSAGGLKKERGHRPVNKQATVAKKKKNVTIQQKKLSKTRIQQLEAARKLTEDAKRMKGVVRLVGQEGKIVSKFIIRPQDFMVKVQTFNCSSKGHTLRSIQAEIICRSFHGKGLATQLIPAGYCEQCRYYYVLSSIYEEYSYLMKSALCDFVNEHDLQKFLQARTLQTNNWRLQSDYNKCGYSVSREQDISAHERIQILESIIDYGIHSRQEVMSFLNWLIAFNKSNPSQSHAIQKWKSDLLEIANKKF